MATQANTLSGRGRSLPTWARPQGGRVRYTDAAAGASVAPKTFSSVLCYSWKQIINLSQECDAASELTTVTSPVSIMNSQPSMAVIECHLANETVKCCEKLLQVSLFWLYRNDDNISNDDDDDDDDYHMTLINKKLSYS